MWLLPLILLIALPRLSPPAQPREKALIVQPNFDADMPWTADSLEFTEQKLALLSKAGRASLLIWPEAPAPFYPIEPAFRKYISRVAEDAQAHFLLGVVAYTAHKEPLNSALMLDPSGEIEGQYDKVNLVPFGEFIPPMFGWVNRITHEIGDFVPGDRVVVFKVDGHGAGAFICYESVLPDFVRQFVHGGAEVLINISNDGYFGHSAARDQHLLIARMRAAENRRWLLRSTNDGITAAIDPRGRVVAQMPPYTQTSALMPFDYVTGETPYTRYGDWFAWGCLGAGLALTAPGLLKKGTDSSVHNDARW